MSFAYSKGGSSFLGKKDLKGGREAQGKVLGALNFKVLEELYLVTANT